MGNTDPNNTRQENKYELDQRINWQIKSLEPLYNAQQVSRWKSSVRDLQGPSTHHSSVVFRHNKSVGQHSDDSVGLLRHDKSVGQSQRGSKTAEIYLNRFSQNHVTNNRSKSASSRYQNHGRDSLELKSKIAQHPKNALSDFSTNLRTPAASRSNSQVVLQPLMGKNLKNKSQGFQRHQIAQIISGERRQSAGIKSRNLVPYVCREKKVKRSRLVRSGCLKNGAEMNTLFFRDSRCHRGSTHLVVLGSQGQRVEGSRKPLRVREFLVPLAESVFSSFELLVVPGKSNAIIGVVTTGFECLPSSCDGLTGPDDHGPMISTGGFAVRGSSGSQAGQSSSTAGRSPLS
ncbi:hypothetical protein F511_29028 [Dorcoceras hygrometricum]|uniref:Uncharacterized protein n=1 Tax=Dorcoceras hygrometricum TaxID=472368 RepID=A0A2Z7BJ78_9LAMI|nr:hypothetical protein F511_29028 [Dorcoceras hygrometricum]